MKIFHRERVKPIYLHPGDQLAVTYRQSGKPDRTVTQTCVDRPLTVNDIAVGDLEERELKELGLADGLAVVLGQRARGR